MDGRERLDERDERTRLCANAFTRGHFYYNRFLAVGISGRQTSTTMTDFHDLQRLIKRLQLLHDLCSAGRRNKIISSIRYFRSFFRFVAFLHPTIVGHVQGHARKRDPIRVRIVRFQLVVIETRLS